MPLTLFAPSPWKNDYFTIGHDLIVLLLRVCMTLLADSDSDLCRLSRNTLAIAGRSTWSANKTGLVLRWGIGNETRFSPNMLIRPYMFLRERIEFFPIVRRCSIKYWIAQPPILSCIGAAAHICMIENNLESFRKFSPINRILFYDWENPRRVEALFIGPMLPHV